MANLPPTLDPEILTRNLDAIRSVNSGLADRLAGLDLTSAQPTPVLTRDGQLGIRFVGPSGSPQWLGRTSIPTVRASALLAQFDPGTGNCLLPGMGEGTEAERLLAKLDLGRVVFIWEADPIAARLVLALHDYGEYLRRQRLVLLVCPLAELAAALVDWLEREPTVRCPSRLMRWPWQEHAEIAEIRAAVETAWGEIHRRHASKSAQ